MRRGAFLFAATVLLATAAPAAWAQEQACLYEGKTYPEGSTVCQAGLLQTCVNGEWQSPGGGARCDQNADDEVVGEGVPGAQPMVDDD